MYEIPRVIHYCWFGGNPLPATAQKCIESWRKYCPGYEIRRWDETNFNFTACAYAKEAYEAKKWAFVSDYARFDILYRHGGLYFDTDVELIAPIDDLLQEGSFLGVERNLENDAWVNPGLGMAAAKGLPFYGEALEAYQKLHFLREDGTFNQTTVVKYTTDLLKKYGLSNEQKIQKIADIWIYPWDYFCPMMHQTRELTLTQNTRSIHHYDASWFTKEELFNRQFAVIMCRWFGVKMGRKIGRIQSFPYRVKKKLKEKGLGGTVKFMLEKIQK